MQRGKFNHNDNQKVNSDEMMNMIQYGAQEIIHTCDKEDDEDIKNNIDAIIAKSQQKTEKFEKKLDLELNSKSLE